MKPCPFCASNEINLHYPDEHGHYVCWCGNCGAFGPNVVSEAKAREMWNLRRSTADLLAACEAAIPILKDYRDFMGQVGAYGQPAELAEDGGYSAIAVSDVCQTALDELTAAIAAAQPVTEQAAQPSGITPKSHLR